MVEPSVSNINKIVAPATPPATNAPPPWYRGTPAPRLLNRSWAPAWFYSALGFLGSRYVAADGSTQSFAPILGGSDVDPYAGIGATRLFLIIATGDSFSLTIASDINANAPLDGGTIYPKSDIGITAMYMALSASPVFSSVNYCYVPGSPDVLEVFGGIARVPVLSRGGYDPATGLRSMVMGSAVAQAVPLDTFLETHNAQIYDPDPKIVPLYSSLVYDVTQNNELGATTFALPVVYTKDQASSGTYYVSKLAGPTVVFDGGPGFDAASAVPLVPTATSSGTSAGQTLTTYTYADATVVTTSTFGTQAQIGVASFTFTGSFPLAGFSNQRIIGFYKDDSWANCLGTPIYDYGSQNAGFTAIAGPMSAPEPVFDPADSFLNGGSLPSVIASLSQATYLYSSDALISILDIAKAAKDSSDGAGLAVTTAALSFDMSSSAAPSLVTALTVPIVANATITPPPVLVIEQPREAARTAAISAGDAAAIAIGTGANMPVPFDRAPVTVQLGLDAFIPSEALAGTGISSIESGTAFPVQDAGSWATLQQESGGVVINLTDTRNADSVPAPYDLSLEPLNASFTAGITYVVSMTGTAVSIRGTDGTSQTATLADPPPDQAHQFVGAVVYSSGTASVPLYPKVSLGLAAPAVGTSGVQQGGNYSIRLTYGAKQSRYDIVDANGGPVATGIVVTSPQPADGSRPVPGDLYFGSVIGGATGMTLWSVPIFLTVTPVLFAGNTVSGEIAISATASGVPGYQLQMTDSSLFVYSNINIDTESIGSVSAQNVFLASAVINSAPDDQTAAAFAPAKLIMGLVRQARTGTELAYVFIPEDDSVLIGGVRYLLSVINLGDLALDLDSLPYPPAYWPSARYWQFANRHNPYLAVRYTGETEADRIAQAQADTVRIGLELTGVQEPMQMYLDTDPGVMTVWPIYEFPYATSTQSVDQGRLAALTTTILDLLKTATPPPAAGPPTAAATVNLEQIDIPSGLQQSNPYVTTATSAAPAASGTAAGAAGTGGSGLSAPGATLVTPVVQGVPVTNLNPGAAGSPLPATIAAQQSQQIRQAQEAAAQISASKNLISPTPVVQSKGGQQSTQPPPARERVLQPVYGFTVYNPGSGEAYIVEVVGTDLAIPDQLPQPTSNAGYDPYYVRVVFLSTLTCYNMSIIVPTVAYDQFGYFAREALTYTNVLSQTNELGLGYLYSLYDSANNFDTLDFTPYGWAADADGNAGANVNPDTGDTEQTPVVFSNLPYATGQTVLFNAASLFANITGAIQFIRPPVPPAYFVCRRENWNADCHLMQATVPSGTSVYLAFGAGDIVPFRLDTAVNVDQRLPAHMNQLSYSFADQTYEAVKTISVGNTPYIISVTTQGGVARYSSLSLDPTAGTADVLIGAVQPIAFPADCYVVGQATTTLTSVTDLNTRLSANFASTGDFVSVDSEGNVTSEFAVVPYNNLVYLIRVVSNVGALADVGGTGITSGLLVDTFVPAAGNLALAQGARYKRSGLSFFGASYTPTTMVDSLDNLDFTSITGETFFAPTIFIPIPEIDPTKGIIADISSFLGAEFWTFIYPEIVAEPGDTTNGVPYPAGFNLDAAGKPVLSLQRLQFVYDPLATMFTPNDLTHKYPLQPKQQILALTNGQLQEGICWRSADVQPGRLAPHNVQAQQLLPEGAGMDAANIIYAAQNRPVSTPISASYPGMSVKSIRSLSGTVYSIEETAFAADQTATGFVSQVSSNANMLVGVLFDYDNNDLGTLSPYDSDLSTKGLVFLNGYLGAGGYAFSSPDHVDVNDVLPSQVPLLEQITGTMGEYWDISFYNADVSLPQQFWSFSYDTLTAAGIPNFIANVPPSQADPTFSNRTRSLVLNLQNPVRPRELGIMDTYSSVVAANLTLENGVTGSVFLSKKADRNVDSIGSNPVGATSFPLCGLPAKYDFFLFSRDHYGTLDDAQFELIDEGYAMCLVDDGSGTGTKVAKFYVDSDGNYYELYSYVVFSPTSGIIETSAFTLKVALGAPANPNTTPATPETPNNVNPQDLVTQINTVSNVLYASSGASAPGQPPAFIPIQAAGGTEVQAGTIMGPPGFGGYQLNVLGANRQPVQISQIYSAGTAYAIAGITTVVPYNAAKQKAVPFYGSISHGLDMQFSYPALYSADLSSQIPRPTGPQQTVTSGLFGGNGLGGLIGTPLSFAFQGSGAIPPQITANPTPGTTMKADDSVFYTVNAVTNGTMDSNGKAGAFAGGQYFIDQTDPANPIYGVVTMPKFSINGNSYTVNLSTTLADGVTSRYTLVAGGKSYLFGPDNAHVTVDLTEFTFNPVSGGTYSVTYAALDAPAGAEAPTPVALTPFSIVAGGGIATIDVFNLPDELSDMILGPIGRLYSYEPASGTVTVTAGATQTSSPLATGLVFESATSYGYVLSMNDGRYAVNGGASFPYNATTTGNPASYPIMTAPQMFTLGGSFYTFDVNAAGGYVSLTGNGQTYPINPYQFSINGDIYIINTNVQPNTVIGNGSTFPMYSGNTQFLIDGVEYTIALKQNSLLGATISGQFNVVQGNVVVIENYAYQLDTLNGQIIGNGLAYPLTTSGLTYSIATLDNSFTVTTERNATTVTIGNIDYLINDTTVVGDGVIYPILVFRSFADGADTFDIGLDGTATTPATFTLTGTAPYTGSTFTDGTTYTVNELAGFDGTTYFLMSGTPPQFKPTTARTFTVRTDGVSVAAGAVKTYLGPTSGPLTPHQFGFGSETIFFGRATDVAAFDGEHYFAIANNEFTDTAAGLTFTLSGNTAVNQGNSYEIFSNLGTAPYFEVPGGSTYQVNVAVADTGSATGGVTSVFPITSGAFTMPVSYTVTVAGNKVSVNGVTIAGGPRAEPNLTAASGALTGGYFVDPVTGITYTFIVDGPAVSVVDSNNTTYPYAAGTFVASVLVTTGVTLAVDNEPTPAVYPVLNNQFITPTATYTINVPVAYGNAAGPYWPMINGRFIVPRTAPLSNLTYTVNGATVTKGYVISANDQFTADGKTVYTVNAVNVVKTSNASVLTAAGANRTLQAGPYTYTLDAATSVASFEPAGLAYNTATDQFTVSYGAGPVTYTVTGGSVADSRHPVNVFAATVSGSTLSFTDSVTGVSFSFNRSGDNPVTAGFAYTNDFFVDAINGITYYIDTTTNVVNAISYLPETTQYGFTAANGVTYLIHFSDVSVVFPVVSGANVNVGVTTIGSDVVSIHVDEVEPLGGGAGIPAGRNSFEINGNLYTIEGTPSGTDYSGCSVVGDAIAPIRFSSANTFVLTDPAVTYTLQLDSAGLPAAVVATFAVRPSRDLIAVNDDVYLISYATTSTGSLLGQGSASIPIANSGFTLTNPFDATKGVFTFADLDIYDAASVVGRFTVYAAPTFVMGTTTYTLDTVNAVVRDSSERPYPLIDNPAMFSIGGANYVIDTNAVPHAIVGDSNVSPLSTDVTIEAGQELANSTFTLGGLVYKYVADASGHLLTVTGTKTYPIAQPALTFKLDSSLIFTISTAAPAAGNYPGSVVPIGTITSGTTTLNLYAGIPESGNADFFTYKNVLYTLTVSAGTYVAVQKSYTVYASSPSADQQRLAVFDLGGTTYLLTDGSTAGSAPPAGINPGTLWSATSVSGVETQFGIVCGFGATPTSVTQTVEASGAVVFQFPITAPTGISTTTVPAPGAAPVITANSATTLYDILFPGPGHENLVQVNVPASLPAFSQASSFLFVTPFPLTLETGGYNAFTTFVAETSSPAESFAGAYKTPVISTDPQIDNLMTAQGDFSLEFWHSIPSSTPTGYHPVTFAASTSALPVYYVDVDFEDSSHVYLGINGTVLMTSVTPPVFSSRWQHFALSYTQPYVMLCRGDGFEVADGSSYNVNRDFSVAFTFSAEDVSTPQGIFYKGSGSPITPPALSMSYRVAVESSTVSITITDATSTPVKFMGPAVLQSDNFYEVVIVKQTTTPLGSSKSTNPYAAPFDASDFAPSMAAGNSATIDPPLTSGSGTVTISGIGPSAGTSTPVTALIDSLADPSSKSHTVSIAIREVLSNGGFGDWTTTSLNHPVTSGDPGLQVLFTGSAHVLIGSAYDDSGQPMPLGSASSAGNVRNVYLFGSAIDYTGIATSSGTIPIAQASASQLSNASIAGYWKAAYDPNGIVYNQVNPDDFAVPSNARLASLAPLAGYEFEGTALFVNGYPMPLSYVPSGSVPPTMPGYEPGSSLLIFDAGEYKLQEISVWRVARQWYQIMDDMFGRLVPSNEPDLILYLSGSFVVPATPGPLLPLRTYLDSLTIGNEITSLDLQFSPASIDLFGSPAVGRCGPLITPNLYTPPGAALTVCDAPPALTTYSVTLNGVAGMLAGEINEAYAYIKNHVLMLYAGKKVGDLTLSWVSQIQSDVQLLGYVEGAPPAPMANLTNKASYAGATSLTFTAPTSVSVKYLQERDGESTTELKLTGDLAYASPATAANAATAASGTAASGAASGAGNAAATAANATTTVTATATTATGDEVKLNLNISPMGGGTHTRIVKVDVDGSCTWIHTTVSDNGNSGTAGNKLDESDKYTVRLEGAMAPYQNDTFMANLNSVTIPSATPGAPASKSAILADPNDGGFTASNPPAQLPKTEPTDEKFGSRMFIPSPYGQAFVSSQTDDVYQQTLVQSNTVYGFVNIPDAQIPRDINIVSFRMNSGYLRPGVLDGVIGYAYNPATLPTGAQTYTTSTGEMQVAYDANFSSGEVGHDASYMRVVEAYALKRQIDQETSTAIALYNTAWQNKPAASGASLVPGLDFYNEYVWSSRGGTHEVKHSWSTSYDEVMTMSSGDTKSLGWNFNLKLTIVGAVIASLGAGRTTATKVTTKYSYTTSNDSSFDITASFDGLETDTQMRYKSANDAHFVMNNNSVFNPDNESGLNLVIGSDGLVYDIVPSVSSGAGLPVSNDIDTSFQYTQPQPSYTTGNADGLTGNLMPYDRPGKISLFRTLAFYLQPAEQNGDDFWNTVVDPVWLANSQDPDAAALRPVSGTSSNPWRLLYRVTYAERFLPPVATEATVVPQIAPLMAVPVLNPASDFLYQAVAGDGARPAHNPANDIEANVVLAAPTASGASAGSTQTAGPNQGLPLDPNNVIPFDLVKAATPIVSWGDAANTKMASRLITSALGLVTVPLSQVLLPGSTLLETIEDPSGDGALYSVYTDPNGQTVNVPARPGLTVFADINGNPIQYFDGQTYHSLQADYVASDDGTVMYYIQPPSSYDQTAFNALGDYDLFGHPGDEWRYYLVSGFSANMTSQATVTGQGPFGSSALYTGFTIAPSQHTSAGENQVKGYVLAQAVLQWPNLNTNAETFADVAVYKSMSLLDLFPIGDPEVLMAFLAAEYPNSPFAGNADINNVFARNIISYFNTAQQALTPQ